MRSNQAEFTNIDPAPAGFVPAVTYEDLEAGEDIWGPKIAKVLEEWGKAHPPPSAANRVDDRDRPEKDYRSKRSSYGRDRRGGGQTRPWNDRRDWSDSRQSKRRNSSSSDR